jgi:glc operon protein GlcG
MMPTIWNGPRRSLLFAPCVLALFVGPGPGRADDPALPPVPGLDAPKPEAGASSGSLSGPAAAPSPVQDAAKPEAGATASALRDGAEMFSPEARARVQETLKQIEQRHHVPIRVETIDSLEGEEVAAVARRRAQESGQKGIYLLMARKETKLYIRISPDFRDRVGQPEFEVIRNMLIEGFRKGDFDEGLVRGVQELDMVLARTDTADRAVHEAKGPTGASGLVARNQVRLTLAGARRIVAGAEAKAAEMGLKVNVMVVDDGGHPLAFARMDGARPASAYTATTKAITAATFRQATGPIPPGTQTPDPLLNLSLQNAAAASGGKLTTLHGGEPVVVAEQVIGAVGVGGGTGEQDAEVARAGVAAFQEGLRAETPGEPADAHKAP